jgi:hypothetical protein
MHSINVGYRCLKALCACTLSVERPLVIRICLATIVACYVSFWLSLEAPSTALVTVAIIAEPTRGPGPGEGSLAPTTNMFSASQYAAEGQVLMRNSVCLTHVRGRAGRSRSLIHIVDVIAGHRYIILNDNPHVYLTQKRVERAQEMLIQTGLSVRGNCVRGRLFRRSSSTSHGRYIIGVPEV